MGIVTDEVKALVRRQVQEHGVVVWFDPDRYYAGTPATFGDDVHVLCYEDSFLKLRRAVDDLHLLDGETPSKLLVYVPLDQATTHDALVELTSVGVELQPGASARSRNTRLALIARRTLEPILGDDGAAGVEKQVAAGKLTLADLDRLAEQGQGVATGAVSLIFGTTNPADVALTYLSSDERDATLLDKEAVPELARLLGTAFDGDFTGATTPADLRERLARHVLVTDFLQSLGSAAPTALANLLQAHSVAGRGACAALAHTWRLRRDLQERSARFADRVEASLGLDPSELALDALRRVETFSTTEEALQAAVEEALLKRATAELVELARDRQSSFWSGVRPTIQARWGLIGSAGQLLLEAERVALGLKDKSLAASALFHAYSDGDHPWCLLDTAHRHLERRAQAFDLMPGVHQHLETLITRARQRYEAVGSDLAERFVDALAAIGYQLPGVLSQREIFRRHVDVARQDGKTAYVLVDALRFEMSRELAQNLGEGFAASIEPVFGTLPSITDVGMAALMPRADAGATLVQVSDSKVALEIDGKVLDDRKHRVDFLRSRVLGQVFECKLENLVPPRKATREGIQAADFVLVTSQEIDLLCEADNVAQARRHLDDVLGELRRAFRQLLDLGIQTIVVAADHGYLFGEEVDDELKIDPPGGLTADLHRRVWVGVGGAASGSYVRLKASDVGLGGNLEIAVPRGFAVFKVPGPNAYFHGGLSPPEIVVPVVVVKSAAPIATAGKGIDWELRPGSKKISTRFFSVTVSARITSFLDQPIPRVRVVLRGKSGAVSTPVSASYGFEEGTGDVQLRLTEGNAREVAPNTVTLMLTESIGDSTVTVSLLDATTGRELKRLGPLDVTIAM